MGKHYNEEFKKQLVREYVSGRSYGEIETEFGVSRSTVAGWVRKYSEECQYSKPQGIDNNIYTAKEIQIGRVHV